MIPITLEAALPRQIPRLKNKKHPGPLKSIKGLYCALSGDTVLLSNPKLILNVREARKLAKLMLRMTDYITERGHVMSEPAKRS